MTRIRQATPADVAAVLKFWTEAAEEPTATDTEAGLRALLERDPSALLLAVDDDDNAKIAGTLVAGWDGWRANLYRLAVAPAARRRGVARGLVAAAETRFRALGARRVHAGVLGRYAGATSFWAAAGYLVDRRITRYRKDLPEQ